MTNKPISYIDENTPLKYMGTEQDLNISQGPIYNESMYVSNNDSQMIHFKAFHEKKNKSGDSLVPNSLTHSLSLQNK